MAFPFQSATALPIEFLESQWRSPEGSESELSIKNHGLKITRERFWLHVCYQEKTRTDPFSTFSLFLNFTNIKAIILTDLGQTSLKLHSKNAKVDKKTKEDKKAWRSTVKNVLTHYQNQCKQISLRASWNFLVEEKNFQQLPKTMDVIMMCMYDLLQQAASL